MEEILEQSGFVILPEKTEKNTRKSMPFILTLISVVSMGWGIHDMFWSELSYTPILITVFLADIFLNIFSKSRKRIVAGFCTALVLVVGVIIGAMTYWSAGAVDFVNRILMKYNYVTGLAIDYYRIPDCPNMEAASYLFFCFFLVLLTFYMGLAILRKHPMIVTSIWLPVIGGSIFFEMPIQGFIIACAVISVVGVFAYSQMNITNDGLYTVTIIILSVLIMVSAGIYFHYFQYKPSSSVEEMQDYLIQKTEEIQYGEADSPQGNLENEMNTSSELRLKVTMSKPECIYLKGYTGSSWENGKWRTLKNTSYSNEYEGMINGYCQQNFHPLAQLNGYSQAASFIDSARVESEEVQVTVRNVDAFRKFTYIPYGISYESLMGLRESNQDIYIPGTTSKNLEDNYYSVSILSTKQDYFLSYNCEDWLNCNSDVNEDTGKYRIAEADYRKFVHKFYASESVTKDINLVDETRKIRKTIKEKGEKAGDWNSANYATEAVTLYRDMGVPTRYVEGYIADARKKETETDGFYHVEVQGQDAHAWIEIYKDGVGWIPVEVTPGFYQNITNSQEEQTQGITSQRQAGADTKQPQQKLGDVNENSEDVLDIVTCLWILLTFVLALILVIVLILVLRRKVILARRKKGLTSENYRIRLEMSVLILKRLFRYKKWEESMLSVSVQNILNAYWYSGNAEEYVTEKEVDNVQNYLYNLQNELVDRTSVMELVRIKYVEVLV